MKTFLATLILALLFFGAESTSLGQARPAFQGVPRGPGFNGVPIGPGFNGVARGPGFSPYPNTIGFDGTATGPGFDAGSNLIGVQTGPRPIPSQRDRGRFRLDQPR